MQNDEIRFELKPESETKFFCAEGSDRQLEFEVDASRKGDQGLVYK